MTLRWISDVPPPMVEARPVIHDRCQRPPSAATLAVDHRQVGALQVEAQLVDPLPQLGDRHLHVAVLGGRRSLRERGEALVAEGPQRPDPHRQLGDLAADDRVAVEAGGLGQLHEVVDAAGRGHHALDPQPAALVGQRRPS